MTIKTGALTGTGATGEVGGKEITFQMYGTFVATIDLQRSEDGRATWRNVAGETYTTPTDKNISNLSTQFSYRLNCSAFTSGTINWVIAN